MNGNNSERDESLFEKIESTIVGAPKDVRDPKIFHKISLIALLAWIGLGSDGLSSSSYGPEEAFRALGSHTYLAIFLALATAATVFIISYAYSKIIEHFPHGGGGYIVATYTLNEKAGVVSGCALLVDYMLTITVSIVACGDAIFSYLPLGFHGYKMFFDLVLIIILIILNIRGVRESVTVLAPIFAVFILTHILLIGYGIVSHLHDIGPVAHEIRTDFHTGISTIGWLGMLAIVLRAYSLGGGTYTGIEAVSNGLQIMREPKVRTGKRTMFYMAVSLALTAGGLFICYLFLRVIPVPGKTLNAILANKLFGNWSFGYWIALITILSEGALLLLAAQTGFIDGPRVMSNMAVDSWFPHRFSSLSERLTMRNGVFLMGAASILLLFYTKGSISNLIVMYAINVFLTFSLSQLGMLVHFIKNRAKEKNWKRNALVFLVGFILCSTILIVTSYQKFREGGWMTLFITAMFVLFCSIIRSHYKKVRKAVRKLDELMLNIPTNQAANPNPLNPKEMTAILLVSGYNGFGVHTFLSVVKNFPHLYKNFIFTSVAVVDSGSFKGIEEVQNLEESVKNGLKKYVTLARELGVVADYRYDMSADVIESATELCKKIKVEFPRCTVFTGQLVFKQEKFFHKMLHNETAFAIQRNLHWEEVATVILPVRLSL